MKDIFLLNRQCNFLQIGRNTNSGMNCNAENVKYLYDTCINIFNSNDPNVYEPLCTYQVVRDYEEQKRLKEAEERLQLIQQKQQNETQVATQGIGQLGTAVLISNTPQIQEPSIEKEYVQQEPIIIREITGNTNDQSSGVFFALKLLIYIVIIGILIGLYFFFIKDKL